VLDFGLFDSFFAVWVAGLSRIDAREKVGLPTLIVIRKNADKSLMINLYFILDKTSCREVTLVNKSMNILLAIIGKKLFGSEFVEIQEIPTVRGSGIFRVRYDEYELPYIRLVCDVRCYLCVYDDFSISPQRYRYI
jgi:hypothetical protein